MLFYKDSKSTIFIRYVLSYYGVYATKDFSLISVIDIGNKILLFL